MAANDVTINIRTRGGRQAARESGMAAAGIRGISRAAETAGRGMDNLGRRITAAPFRFAGQQARYAALGLEALGAAAVWSGLKFNASMEQNQIAFSHFLGSERAARRELTFLYDLAKVTPFQFTDLTLATRKFLAFGFSVGQSNALLKTVADTSSGLALDEGGIDRMILAIGQIKSKGKLDSQDLRQLQELGAVDMNKLAKGLGLTREELGEVGKHNVPATKALRALKAQWDDTFGGMSAKQAKSFTGQISTLRDNVNQMLGTLTKPGFNALRDKVLPQLNRSAEQINTIFGRTDIDTAEKFTLSRAVLRRNLGPIMDEIGREIGEMNLGDKLADGFEAAVPRIADAFGRAAPKFAGALVRGFLNAGPYGQMFTVALLASRLGAFTALGRLAAGRFRRSWRRHRGTLPVPPIAGGPGGGGGPVVAPVPGGGKGKGGGRFGWLKRGVGKWGGRALKIGGVAAVAGAFIDPLLNPDEAGLSPEEERARLRRRDASRRGEHRRPRAHAGRARPGVVVHVNSPMKLTAEGGRLVAKHVERAQADAAARR